MADSKAAVQSKLFASFELFERVGHGGMAAVFRGRRLGRGEVIAVKIVSRRVAEDPEVAARFRHECEFACTVDHPNLVRALEYGVCDKMPYLVMEYVPGMPLNKVIHTEGPLPEERAVQITAQLGAALDYLHARQIVHRDIKPENVLVTPQGVAKLADFGLLKDLESHSPLTKTKMGLGTYEYSAPEQYDDAKNADPRSDVFSLAATLYSALTGAFPFGSGSNLKILKRKLENDFEAPINLVPSLSPAVNDAICRALNAKREVRPRTAQEFVALLHKDTPVATLRPTVAEPELRSGIERRATVRHEIDMESSCEMVLQSKPTAWSATIQDVSATGLCLRMRRRFEIGTSLRVTLKGLSEEVSYLAKVCWVKQLDANQYLHGGAFTSPLTAGDLETICFEGRGKTKYGSAAS